MIENIKDFDDVNMLILNCLHILKTYSKKYSYVQEEKYQNFSIHNKNFNILKKQFTIKFTEKNPRLTRSHLEFELPCYIYIFHRYRLHLF